MLRRGFSDYPASVSARAGGDNSQKTGSHSTKTSPPLGKNRQRIFQCVPGSFVYSSPTGAILKLLRHFLLRRVDVWSLARTIFPLGWLSAIVLFLLNYLFWGGLVVHWAREFGYDVSPAGAGVILGLLLSILFGFLSAVMLTLTGLIMAVIYNLLAALGGGVRVELSEAPSQADDVHSE